MKTPILGNKCTPEQRAEIELELQKAIHAITQGVARDLEKHLVDAASSLTDSELLQVSLGGTQHFRAARCLLCATATERIQIQWQAEATKLDTKRVSRWLKGRV